MKSNSNKILHLGDVVKMTRPTIYTTLVKPIGSVCNMDCNYCYYKDKEELYEGRKNLMNDEVLENYIKQYLTSVQQPTVSFCWHGGEPLLAGLDFYKKAVLLQDKYKKEKKIENSLQTNGILINEQWCDFFRENNFLIGLSLDGPQDVHDAFRRDSGGAPTFERVMRSVEMMTNMGVEFNILSTVNSRSEGRGSEIYKFLTSISKYIQFLPVVEYVKMRDGNRRPLIVSPDEEDAVEAPWSVCSKGFGQFMCDVFDSWVVRDISYRYVQLFDVTLCGWCGVPSSLCAFSEICGDGMVVEHNGDVYSCDHFVYPEYLLGNIKEKSLTELYNSPQQREFGSDKRDALPLQCKRCNYHFLCRGECPKHRFETTDKGQPYLNTLCEGYKMFFTHTDPFMRRMKTQIEKELPPADIMQWAREKLLKK